MNDHVSPRRRREVIDALRRGTVPANGLDLLAVGLERFTPALDGDLDAVAGGGSAFKAVRGEYGAGKTFVTRYVAERALRRGFASAEVQISETETPLHKLETVYRRVGEALRTAAFPPSALRPVLDSWLFTLESDATAADPGLAGRGQAAVDEAVEVLLEQRLAAVSVRTPGLRPGAAGLPVGRDSGRRRGQPTRWRRGWAASRTSRRQPSGAPGSGANWTTSARWGSCRACWKCSATPGIPGCCWCLMRWRRCSGSAVMSGTRP